MRHDLKAPLNAIINLPPLVGELGELSAEQRDLLGEIESAGRRMLSQIDQSLDLYKMETGAYAFTPEAVNIAFVLTRVVAELHGLPEASGARVELRMAGRPLTSQDRAPVAGVELLCHTLLANLIKNAIEATPPGGVVTVDVTAGEEARRVAIAIHNELPVPEPVRPVFFEKYTTFSKQGGTGLGAYSARLMAQTQGGSIEMETSDGQGTTVTVRLPLLVEQEEAVPEGEAV